MLEYNEMVTSFIDAGFTEEFCEFLYADNSKENVFDAFGGINRFLQEAEGRYIILCHQDILLHDDNISVLEKRIEEMDALDPHWGILANAGGINLKHVAMHVTQKTGHRLIETKLPLKSISSDENFILVKNEANLALSSDLQGFHLYGTDICLIADILGFNSYIIDFNVLHKSDGNPDKGFYKMRTALKKKYRSAFKSRFMSTTITRFYISGNSLSSSAYNTALLLFLARQYYKIFKPKKGYHLKK
ncbi:hypothetical protein WG906_11950 [Pedobacter sp. P351]|uniref:hypothetical protein n=1 Tax=Pedobacter superstes TaxID=3133441 RepID=UPI0030B5B1A1